MLFNVTDLIDRLNEIKNDGYNTVDIDIIEADDELPACMSFCVEINDFKSIDYEEVDAIDD